MKRRLINIFITEELAFMYETETSGLENWLLKSFCLTFYARRKTRGIAFRVCKIRNYYSRKRLSNTQRISGVYRTTVINTVQIRGVGKHISVISRAPIGLSVLIEQFPSLVSSYNPRAFWAPTLEITALTLSVVSSRNLSLRFILNMKFI